MGARYLKLSRDSAIALVDWAQKEFLPANAATALRELKQALVEPTAAEALTLGVSRSKR